MQLEDIMGKPGWHWFGVSIRARTIWTRLSNALYVEPKYFYPDKRAVWTWGKLSTLYGRYAHLTKLRTRQDGKVTADEKDGSNCHFLVKWDAPVSKTWTSSSFRTNAIPHCVCRAKMSITSRLSPDLPIIIWRHTVVYEPSAWHTSLLLYIRVVEGAVSSCGGTGLSSKDTLVRKAATMPLASMPVGRHFRPYIPRTTCS